MHRIFKPITAARQAEIFESLHQSALISGDYLLFVVLSCVIATFGLVLDSGAVVIGAMLIAPLMPAILALALGLVTGDLTGIARALGTLLAGILLAALLSAGLGLLVSGSAFNFLGELPGEILNRTQPTLFDLAIALAGGAAAAYATAQPHLSATLPGVAIATALMPPICVVGIGLSQGRWEVAGGALLLFLANFVAIAFTSAVVFMGVGFGPDNYRGQRVVLPRLVALPGALLVLVAVPLTLLMVRIVADANENNLIRTILMEEVSRVSASGTLVNFEKSWQEEHLALVTTVRLPRSLTYGEANHIQEQLAVGLQKPLAVTFLIVPVTELAPFLPPTLTATPPPDATMTPSPPPATATATGTPPAPGTATPTRTASPTVTLRPAATPAQVPTASATPIAYAVVGGTGERGVYVRRSPGLSQVLGALPDGTIIQLTGNQADADGYRWREGILPGGRVGWIAETFLVPYRPYIRP